MTADISREPDDDHVEMWAIPWYIHREWPEVTDGQVRSAAKIILTMLVEEGSALETLTGRQENSVLGLLMALSTGL